LRTGGIADPDDRAGGTEAGRLDAERELPVLGKVLLNGMVALGETDLGSREGTIPADGLESLGAIGWRCEERSKPRVVVL
jgi:hypothetical protein